ncbi:MAG: tripartite tricarboxylate transporter TctB family protein [Burkholderiaceae bacterium]
MALDRWLALIFLGVSVAYGYEAFVTIEAGLLPFERHESFLPNSLPKVLTVISIGLCLFILIFQKSDHTDDKAPEINLKRWHDYHFGQAGLLLGGMVAYALALRPLGFLVSTVAFIAGSAFVLGERRWLTMLLSSVIGAGVIWWLVQVVLGIFLRPWPGFLTGG